MTKKQTAIGIIVNDAYENGKATQTSIWAGIENRISYEVFLRAIGKGRELRSNAIAKGVYTGSGSDKIQEKGEGVKE